MKKAFKLIFVLIITVSCNNKPIETFELSITDHNYSLAYSILYILSNNNLTITFQGDLKNEKDSVLFSTTKLPQNKIRQLSNINIDNLNVMYSNSCIEDGDIKSFRFTKNGKSKHVSLQNYYHKELSPAIEIINKIVPEKFKMHYNKTGLIKDMKACGEFQIIKSYEAYNTEN
ncbi:hypothetical protein FPF71_02125 [Algibacter amylolyticus]|uniref:Lipoprotein n=1 Tax=Algibacter amylolyticus TaxID=1608400 RepID=A0A5M7BFK7_9FLAO|nr:hypothetical protein [Algibacter amylolyticus]KAA5827660.1 hypothetical protein F2B50_02125 [Algibacter amylolyticus]MBB5266875.1 hypothetical protein [Algibacter amylolyticus]TSJ81905.1 hypothetical protein FPF71_02125 [Algibacter amylolyticus]